MTAAMTSTDHVRFGHISPSALFAGPATARDSEALGFDVQYLGDNACTGPDVFAELLAAAEATTTIRLASGVTNFVTRHPSVIGASIGAVHVRSGGRAICGVGKGDSSVGMVGRKPQANAAFEADLLRLRSHLGASLANGAATPADAPRLAWLDATGVPPVPVEVVASGPRTLAVAGALADRVTLAVGASPERVAWAIEIVERAIEQSGRRRSDVAIGAFVCIALDDDSGHAVSLLRNRVKSWAHMASFPGHDLAAQPEIMRRTTEVLRTAYDYQRHDQRPDNPLQDLIPAEFAAWFGIGGSAGYLVERLGALVARGLQYINFIQLPPAEKERVASTVMPQLRTITR